MKNKHDDTKDLYKTISSLRYESENFPADSYTNQLLNWLEELDQRRDDYKIEFYGEKGAVDNIQEFEKLKDSLKKEIEKNNGEESNIECIIIDQLVELISKMNLQEIRKSNIFK